MHLSYPRHADQVRELENESLMPPINLSGDQEQDISPYLPSPPPMLRLPFDLLFVVSGYCDAKSLLSLCNSCITSYTTLNEEYWCLCFLSRWGKQYKMDTSTRVSPSVSNLLHTLTSSSRYFWNSIEISFTPTPLRTSTITPNVTEDGSVVVMETLGPRTLDPARTRAVQNVARDMQNYRPKTRSRCPIDLSRALSSTTAGRILTRAPHMSRSQSRSSPAKIRSNSMSNVASPSLSALTSTSSIWTPPELVLGDPQHWKAAVLLRDLKGPEEVELRKCTICNELDLYTRAMQRNETVTGACAHSCSLWVSPCSCDTYAHRDCMEQKWGQHQAMNDDPMRCLVCGSPYAFSKRLPVSFRELIRETWAHRSMIAHRILTVHIPLYLLLITVVTLLENSRIIFGLEDVIYTDISDPFDTWSHLSPSTLLTSFATPYHSSSGIHFPSPLVLLFLFFHHLLICIFVSERFHQAISRIWMTPIFPFYIKLYIVMVSSFILFTISFIRLPLPSWLSHLFLHTHASPLQFLICYLNAIGFMISASVVILLFWKTYFKIASVQDQRQPQQRGREGCVTCGITF